MTNHVHLLVTPTVVGAASAMMQALGRRYVGYFNTRYRRTGTLWEGRFKACLVDSDDYLLRCYRYVELNPVRARMVDDPGRYRWSSYACNAMGADDWLVTPHPSYLSLGATRKERCAAYADLVSRGLDESQAHEVKQYLHQQRALGGERFRAQIAEVSGRVVCVRSRGGQPRAKP